MLYRVYLYIDSPYRMSSHLQINWGNKEVVLENGSIK